MKPEDIVAEMLDIWGRPLEGGVLRVEHEVCDSAHGIYLSGDPVLFMGVRGDRGRTQSQDYFDLRGPSHYRGSVAEVSRKRFNVGSFNDCKQISL